MVFLEDKNLDMRLYYTPTLCTEVAAIFVGDNGEPPANRDICVYPVGDTCQNISPLNQCCDPMTYPLVFPRGECSWNTGMEHVEERRTENRTCVTQLQYYAYRLSQRNGFSILHSSDIPQYYVFDKSITNWKKRQRGGQNVIGRLPVASILDTERYYLRLLLLRKSGAVSFDDILPVNGLKCITFQQASQEYGLLRDGPARTGETFVHSTLLHTIRGKGDDVIPVTSTGIAATLLIAGRTAHSVFKIPIHLNATSTCNLKPNTKEADMLMKTKLIVWDEAPVTHVNAFLAVDRLLQDLTKCKEPFWGKVIVLEIFAKFSQ
ncbi:hypothetical protein AVEN_260237-1 [Araneus ventricosus]|uniref:ATP-dependent DNA helicase n=1 Tax=Araneus ventricosus TaxID=182803 RepID=A0A4Y2PW90_ARAVE|nr:hypothetical protein AVEN_260237-1 [Araneus ventricosus]